jgi:iduronate 2-sulfatase
LLIRVPGQKTAGQKCEAPVEFLDIYPTLADVCGVPIPAGLDGVSLKPLIENPSASLKKVAISQYPRGGQQTGNRPLMGYSVRDERWRLTVWRDRKNQETVATELYDEKNDPAETVNLSGKPENKAVVEALSKHLPAQAAPLPAATNAAAAQPVRRPAADRAALFERKDVNHDGKLSREEFMANQPDPEAAAKRWETFDTNQDGFLSRDEFITLGGTKPAQR